MRLPDVFVGDLFITCSCCRLFQCRCLVDFDCYIINQNTLFSVGLGTGWITVSRSSTQTRTKENIEITLY